MNYYKLGLVVIGQSEWGVSQYEALAKKLWTDVTAPYAIISITKNGDSFMISPYQDKSEASDHYGTVTDIPGTAAYVAYFDRNVRPGEQPLIDSAFFRPTEVEKTVEKVTQKVVETPKKSNLGLAFALGAMGLAGLVAYKPKGRAKF